MGVKTSMILIENRQGFNDDMLLLKKLHLDNFKYVSTTTFDACMYPRDNSINIAYYNNCIIICDDFQLTEQTIQPGIRPIERSLMWQFPESEIISVMCHSVTNAHGYSIVKGNRTIRRKSLDADQFYFEKGKPVEQEKAIYARCIVKDGIKMWPDGHSPDGFMLEDQLMEVFTFGIASRLLGFTIIDSDNDEYFMCELPFKKYMYAKPKTFQEKIMSLFKKQ